MSSRIIVPRLSRRRLAKRATRKETAAKNQGQIDRSITDDIDKLAASIVDAAMSSAEAVDDDPMLGELTGVATLLRSVVTRAGQHIPDIVALALKPHGDYTVLREHALPLMQTAADIVDHNKKTHEVEVACDTRLLDFFKTDLIIFDNRNRHCTLLECLRGSAASFKRAKDVVRTVKIAALSARSALEGAGYRVHSVSCAVFDRYGRSGLTQEMAIRRDEIDDFVSVPVIEYLDFFDQRIRKALDDVIATFTGGEDKGEAAWRTSTGADGQLQQDLEEDDEEPSEAEEKSPTENKRPSFIDISRSIGPAEQRRRLASRADVDRDLNGHSLRH